MGLSADEARDVAESIPLPIDRFLQRELVGELVDAILDDSPQRGIEQLADRIATSKWATDLQPAVQRGLEEQERQLREELALVERARADAAKPVRATRLPAAVVERLALDLVDEIEEGLAELESIEEELDDANLGPDERRSIELRLPGKVAGAAQIPAEDAHRLSEVMREVVKTSFAEGEDARPSFAALEAQRRAVATDERRATIRAALAELAENSRDALPRVAAAADELAGTPAPDDPEQDEVWVAAMNALATQVLVDTLGK